MKKIIQLSVALLATATYAQIGINIEHPKATLDIHTAPNTDVNDGILIPRVNTGKRSSFTNPETGLMIYNTDLKCYETNVGTPASPNWQCLATADKVQTISLEPVGFIGNFRRGDSNDPSVRKVVFRVTNNTNSTISGIDLSYIHVEGSSQYIEPGQHTNVTIGANQSIDLEYGISGSNYGAKSIFTLTYDNISSASITLTVDREGLDNNYVATGDGGTADFVDTRAELFLVKDNSSATPIDESFTITATNPLKVKIPFTNGTGNYIAYEKIVSIQDADGNGRLIKLSYPEGNLDIGKGEIEATITSEDGNDLKLPQTAIATSTIIAQIPLKLNNADKGTFDLIAFGGIPDKRFGDGSGHDFVYMPIKTPTGRTWLNNNLGAEYSRVESSVFDPKKQADSEYDINAYGSRFQYRRAADGHELTKVENGQYIVNTSIINTLSSDFAPNTTDVIENPLSSSSIPEIDRKYNWVNQSYLDANATEWESLWKLNGANSPCPSGYRLPTKSEIEAEVAHFEQLSTRGANAYALKLTARSIWSSESWWDKNGGRLLLNPSNVFYGANGHQIRNAVRCIKD